MYVKTGTTIRLVYANLRPAAMADGQEGRHIDPDIVHDNFLFYARVAI
jgi:hypothetical protein